MKTPGVYMEEKNAFPNSVTQVETAIPVFIGFTQKAISGSDNLTNKPFRISSLAEYMQFFGGAPDYKFRLTQINTDAYNNSTKSRFPLKAELIVTKGDAKVGYTVSSEETIYWLYNAMRLFYSNGGGACYILSVGDYDIHQPMNADLFRTALKILEKELEPTIVLVPDAVSLGTQNDFDLLNQDMLAHCGNTRNRIALLDVYNGFMNMDETSGGTSIVEAFREGVGTNALSYGAAYYPWIETTIVKESELSFHNLIDISLGTLAEMIGIELNLNEHCESESAFDAEKKETIADLLSTLSEYTDELVKNWDSIQDKDKLTPEKLNQTLISLSPLYKSLLRMMQERLNLMSPAPAIAGLYTMVDAGRGVWKAPANISMNSVIKPTVNISFENQQNLSKPANGKAINAIRLFVGEGVLVWGASTLDGNNQDWRYINVRRTVIMLEQSVISALSAYIFEPNDFPTWASVKSMIEQFLFQLWKMGALAGEKPAEAYAVRVGLGETMTQTDVKDGIMRITLMVAVSRPAEFIVINFLQQVLKMEF